MKTWVAGLIGFGALAAVTAGAFLWTQPASGELSPYWECMAEYGYSPDTPVSPGLDDERLGEADRACS